MNLTEPVEDTLNLEQVKHELKALGQSPVAERMYPITSDWVPLADVLAIINRFQKHWEQNEATKKSADEKKLISEILGKP